ncbi:hypothetical protein Scep_028520 [Stephania cephalantha]|uniref:Uncharacterized protein n=1 Tax=Stephania cephalantha TaxID=152367 RepID=A0AAP0EHF1_9MAGN
MGNKGRAELSFVPKTNCFNVKSKWGSHSPFPSSPLCDSFISLPLCSHTSLSRFRHLSQSRLYLSALFWFSSPLKFTVSLPLSRSNSQA